MLPTVGLAETKAAILARLSAQPIPDTSGVIRSNRLISLYLVNTATAKASCACTVGKASKANITMPSDPQIGWPDNRVFGGHRLTVGVDIGFDVRIGRGSQPNFKDFWSRRRMRTRPDLAYRLTQLTGQNGKVHEFDRW